MRNHLSHFDGGTHMMDALRRRPCGALVGTFVATLALLAATPASAENQQVQVQENVFVLPGIAVKPGESVTWDKPTRNDRHNVHFDDGTFIEPPAPLLDPWTRVRTFTTPGTYRYHCDEHGGFGGTGMSGVVYVNATGTIPGVAPTASFTVSPAVARVGQSVTVNAMGTTETDPGDSIIRHEWDLDGNGSYETDTGTVRTTSQSYVASGQRILKLRVTDSQGHISETTRSLSVTSAPVASFTASPSPALPGQTVSFNGSTSSDPDGTLAKYEWDLDGNGSYETDTGSTPTASRAYAGPGTVNVKLRVTDDVGVSSETTRSLQVRAPAVLPPPQGVAPILPAPSACGTLKGSKRAACIQRSCRKVKRSRRAACIQKSCRFLTRGKRPACIRKSCRYVTRSKRSACLRKSCSTLKGAKKRACIKKYRPRR